MKSPCKIVLAAMALVLGLSFAAIADEDHPVLDAGDKPAIMDNLGREVTVRGRLLGIGALNEEYIIFLNFAGNKRGDFCGIVRQPDLPALRLSLGDDFPYALEGKTVEISGRLTDHKGTPQIEIKSSEQIRVIADD